jgi:hypothetical protein
MKGWRTLGFNVATAAIIGLVGYNWSAVLPPELGWVGGAIVAAGNFYLRFITTGPVGRS